METISAYQWGYEHDDWPIEGRDDENETLGLGPDLGAHGPKAEVEVGFVGRCPFFDGIVGIMYILVCCREVKAGGHVSGESLRASRTRHVQLGLESGTSEVVLESIKEALLVVLEHVTYLSNLLLSVLDGLELSIQESATCACMDLGKGH